MVAGEEKLVAIEQGAVSAGVARGRDREKIGCQLDGGETFEYALGIGLRGQL